MSIVLSMIPIGCGGDASGQQVERDASGVAGSFAFERDGFVASVEMVDDHLEISVTAPTTGWVAVGFEPTAMMRDANLIVGYVDAGGTLHIRDDYGTGATSHEPDVELGGTSDFYDESGSEDAGSTSVSFSLPLDSGDEYDRSLMEDNDYTVLFAYGGDGADDFSSYHAWAGLAELRL